MAASTPPLEEAPHALAAARARRPPQRYSDDSPGTIAMASLGDPTTATTARQPPLEGPRSPSARPRQAPQRYSDDHPGTVTTPLSPPRPRGDAPRAGSRPRASPKRRRMNGPPSAGDLRQLWVGAFLLYSYIWCVPGSNLVVWGERVEGGSASRRTTSQYPACSSLLCIGSIASVGPPWLAPLLFPCL